MEQSQAKAYRFLLQKECGVVHGVFNIQNQFNLASLAPPDREVVLERNPQFRSGPR
jgi:hypothetical protein